MSKKPIITRRRITHIVPDGTYPGMWRVRRPDGTLSDMVNRARAEDAVRVYSSRTGQ